MNFGLVVDTLSLAFAAVNIVLVLSVLSRFTSVAEAPRAWNLLTLGMSLVVIRFSVDVFILFNPYFDLFLMNLLSSAASLLGFAFLLAGVHRVWEVVYA